MRHPARFQEPTVCGDPPSGHSRRMSSVSFQSVRSGRILNSAPLRLFQLFCSAGLVRRSLQQDFLFETQWDGFRALLYSDNDGVRLMSRNGNIFRPSPNSATEWLATSADAALSSMARSSVSTVMEGRSPVISCLGVQSHASLRGDDIQRALRASCEQQRDDVGRHGGSIFFFAIALLSCGTS